MGNLLSALGNLINTAVPSGFGTYLTIGVYVAAVLVENVLGFDIKGFDAGPDWVNDLLTAVGAGFLRRALPVKAPV